VLGVMIAGSGDDLPGQRHAGRRHLPTGTTQWEKRNITLEIPVWDESLCIQCGKCAFVCPHAVIREKIYDPSYLEKRSRRLEIGRCPLERIPRAEVHPGRLLPKTAPAAPVRRSLPGKGQEPGGPQSDQHGPQMPIREVEAVNWDYFLSLPEVDRTR
jgi:pyruvate-ferredoxin/flavodoxin oxidoreductase